MKQCRLCDLPDATLLSHLDALDARDCGTTAELLAYLGEVDARKLYLPAGYPSMYVHCIGHRKYSEDVAYKRIRAARVARRFPVILNPVANGRLHLSGLVLLAPYLTEGTAKDLVSAAENKTNAEIERLLASRFPRPDLPARIDPIIPSTYACQLAVRPVEPAPEPVAATPENQIDPASPAPEAVRTEAMAIGPEESRGAAGIDIQVPRRAEAGRCRRRRAARAPALRGD